MLCGCSADMGSCAAHDLGHGKLLAFWVGGDLTCSVAAVLVVVEETWGEGAAHDVDSSWEVVGLLVRRGGGGI